jgi:hypothetical protein
MLGISFLLFEKDLINFLQVKSSGGHQAKKKKGGKNLSPRNRKACHSVSTALLQSVAEIGTQSAMKSSRNTWDFIRLGLK